MQHISCNASGGRGAILSIGKNSDDNIMFPNLASSVIIIIMRRYMLWPFMLFVKKALCSDVFWLKSANPSYGVVPGVGHHAILECLLQYFAVSLILSGEGRLLIAIVTSNNI